MTITEALETLKNNGYILEDTETEEDRLDDIRGDEWRLNAQYDRDHQYSDYHNITRKAEIRKRARELQQSSVEQKIANAKKFNGEKPKEVNSLNNYAEMLKSLDIKIDEYKVGRVYSDAMDAEPGYIQFDLGMGKLKNTKKYIIVRGELNFEGEQTKLILEVVTEYSKALVKTFPRVEKEVSGVSEAKKEIIKYCSAVVAKDKLARFVNGVFRGSVPPYVSIAGLQEAKKVLKKAGFLVETNKRSAAFYYRAKVFEKIQQIFDERAALARKTIPNVRGWKLDTLKSYIRAYGYQNLNKLIDGEFEAGVSVKEAAEKCIDWFLDIVQREG